MKFSDRVEQLPPYLFVGISRAIAKKKAEGIDVISFGVGDPDIPTHEPVLDRLDVAARDTVNHRYPESEGLPAFRQAVSDFYGRRFGVKIDPETETINLIGAKEGIAHIALCVLNPDDIAITPDPSYPVYDIGTMFAGGKSWKLPLFEKDGWLPNFADIPSEVASKAKAIWLNYPNNPTGGIATPEFFQEAVEFAEEHDLFLLHDACYTEVTYDGYVAPSILQTKGAMERTVEFHSLSKTANMTGWRVGMASGNSEMINALMRVKSNIDSGSPQALQEMGVTALNLPQNVIDANNDVYRRRRDKLTDALNRIGLSASRPKAGLYLWTAVPAGYSSAEFTEKLLEKANVAVTPGTGYGESGEGYIRLSLTIPDDSIDEGLRRLSEFSLSG